MVINIAKNKKKKKLKTNKQYKSKIFLINTNWDLIPKWTKGKIEIIQNDHITIKWNCGINTIIKKEHLNELIKKNKIVYSNELKNKPKFEYGDIVSNGQYYGTISKIEYDKYFDCWYYYVNTMGAVKKTINKNIPYFIGYDTTLKRIKKLISRMQTKSNREYENTIYIKSV